MKRSEEPESAQPPRAANALVNLEVAYEPRDVEVSRILVLGLALALAVMVAGVVVWLTLRSLSAKQARSEAPESPLRVGLTQQLPPEPRLQGAPGHNALGPEDLKEMEDSANATLSSYGWVDQKAGIARVPIQEAMKLLLTRGLPTAQQTSGAQPNGSNPAPTRAPRSQSSGKQP